MNWNRVILSAAFCSLMTIAVPMPLAAQDEETIDPEASYAQGELLVNFSGDIKFHTNEAGMPVSNDEEVNSLLRRFNVRQVRKLSGTTTFVIMFPREIPVQEVMTAFLNLKNEQRTKAASKLVEIANICAGEGLKIRECFTTINRDWMNKIIESLERCETHGIAFDRCQTTGVETSR